MMYTKSPYRLGSSQLGGPEDGQNGDRQQDLENGEEMAYRAGNDDAGRRGQALRSQHVRRFERGK